MIFTLTAKTILILLIPSACLAQTITLPEQVRGDPGRLIVLAADTDCTNLIWRPLDKGLQTVPAHLLADSRTTVLVAAAAGRYRLLCVGAKADKPAVAETVVLVGDSPTPDGGGGFPGDPPPEPSGPTVDELKLTLSTAASNDGLTSAQLLSVSYVAKRSRQFALDKAQTWPELEAGIKAIAVGAGVSGHRQTMGAVSTYLKAVLPWSYEGEGRLTQADRNKCAMAFETLEAALEKVIQSRPVHGS